MDTQEIPVQSAAEAAEFDPVEVLKERIRENEAKKVEVPTLVDAFIAEMPELHPLLTQWDGYPRMAHVVTKPLNIVTSVVEEPSSEAKPVLPWYRRIFSARPMPIPMKKRTLTREAACWEVASVNPAAARRYVEIYIDVQTGAAYYKNLHDEYAYELQPEHLLELSYTEITKLIESLHAKRSHVQWEIDWREERQRRDEEALHAGMQSDAMEQVRERIND